MYKALLYSVTNLRNEIDSVLEIIGDKYVPHRLVLTNNKKEDAYKYLYEFHFNEKVLRSGQRNNEAWKEECYAEEVKGKIQELRTKIAELEKEVGSD